MDLFYKFSVIQRTWTNTSSVFLQEELLFDYDYGGDEKIQEVLGDVQAVEQA